MKQQNTGNGIHNNGDGTATVKCGRGTVEVRYEGDHEAVTGYGAAYPEIMQFCTEREIGPGAVVKVKL